METEKKANLPMVTFVLAGINIVLFLIVDLFLFHRQSEIAYFMALNPVLVMRGEYWRLFTSMFYHFGIDHLVCNMLMLFILGSMLEPFFGKVRYSVLYFVSGLAAGGASLLYNGLIQGEEGKYVLCAGASGAVYGLIGAYAAIFLAQRKTLTQQEKNRLFFAVAFLLFGGIFDTGVGHDAHFGGFFAGLLLGSIDCIRRKRKQENHWNRSE